MGITCFDNKSFTKRNTIENEKNNIHPKIPLLKNFKSIYLLNHLFSFINEYKKLEIIKYNNYTQKKLQIYIDDYEKFSGRYKIGENNGVIKEYKIDEYKLIFEGEYANGKRNG